jgi:putative transposase
MVELIRKSHNVSLLMCHFVFVSKYRRFVITEEVDSLLNETCIKISKCYELRFLEIGTEGDHLHLLIQSVPAYSVTKVVKTVESITAREIFTQVPSVKKKLWGGEFGSSGYFVPQLLNMPMKKSFVNILKIKAEMVNTNNYTKQRCQIINLPCFRCGS